MSLKPKLVFIFLAVVLAVVLVSPALVQGAEIPNPLDTVLSKFKVNPAEATVIDIIFVSFAGFVGIFAVLAFGFLVFNAFKLIIARDNEEAITKAKSGIWWSVWGFVAAILAFSIVSAVSTLLGGTGRDELASPDQLNLPIADAGFMAVFRRVINGILGLSTVAAILMIVYSGIKMVYSSGNEEEITKAKTILRWAIVGVVIILLSYTILNGVSLILQ